jgi:hypothetical protein
MNLMKNFIEILECVQDEKEIIKVEYKKDGQPLRRSNISSTWHFVKQIKDF